MESVYIVRPVGLGFIYGVPWEVHEKVVTPPQRVHTKIFLSQYYGAACLTA